MRLSKLSAAAVVLLFPVVASADPCTGAPPFTDVSALANYCTNTEWLKNRSVTLGCIGTNYCPDEVVTRGSMALFMNRLGVAVTPIATMTEDQNGATDLDVDTFHCVSPVYTITDYPRTMVLTGHFSGLTNAAANYNVTIRFNTDGSPTIFNGVINGSFEKTGSNGANWTHSSTSATLGLEVGSQYRFALRTNRDSGAGDLIDRRCHLLQTLQNRNSATSPFDQAPARSGWTDE